MIIGQYDPIEVDTFFGTLKLPSIHCLECMALNKYMSCTYCEFKAEMKRAASKKYKELVADKLDPPDGSSE